MNVPTWKWLRYVALQESKALRAYVKAGKWPRCTGTDFRG